MIISNNEVIYQFSTQKDNLQNVSFATRKTTKEIGRCLWVLVVMYKIRLFQFVSC